MNGKNRASSSAEGVTDPLRIRSKSNLTEENEMKKVICPTCGYEVEIDADGTGLCERDNIWVKPANDGTNDGVIASNWDVAEAVEEQYKNSKH